MQVKNSERRAYLLNFFDQPAFRAVEMLRLQDTPSFEDFTVKLIERFDSGKTREDYKLQLRARCQKPSEDMESYGDSLMDLAENAYPKAAYSLKVELADLRERLFMRQPGSLTEAIRVVRQLDSARKACKPSGRNKSLNAVASSTADQKITAEIRKLKELVLEISKKVEELERKTAERDSGHVSLGTFYVLRVRSSGSLCAATRACKRPTQTPYQQEMGPQKCTVMLKPVVLFCPFPMLVFISLD